MDDADLSRRSEAEADATQLLLAWRDGDASALDRLMPIVEGELRRAARKLMAGEQRALTLQPTALVNEAFLRLVNLKDIRWQNRAEVRALRASPKYFAGGCTPGEVLYLSEAAYFSEVAVLQRERWYFADGPGPRRGPKPSGR